MPAKTGASLACAGRDYDHLADLDRIDRVVNMVGELLSRKPC
jgi:hypothetical protein